MKLILFAFLLVASPSPRPIEWSHSIAQAYVIVAVGDECTRPGATDMQCIYVRVSLNGGDTLVVNRQTGATGRCHASIYEAVEKCKP